jgi:hypothetical protein
MAEQEPHGPNGLRSEAIPESPPAESAIPAAASESQPAVSPPEEANWHVEAGRKGGRRYHQLIQLGLQYEQEHGLKRGRQRLRQLIQEGRIYEQEHGLAPKNRRTRGSRSTRIRSDQLLQSLCRILVRLSKPVHRENIAKMLQALEEEKRE